MLRISFGKLENCVSFEIKFVYNEHTQVSSFRRSCPDSGGQRPERNIVRLLNLVLWITCDSSPHPTFE